MINTLFHLGKQFPKKYEREADRIMSEAGSPNPGAYFIGISVIVLSAIFVLALLSSFLFFPLTQFLKEVAFSMSHVSMDSIFPVLALVFSVLAVLFSWTLIIAYYVFLADARRSAVESVLPEFLSMVSSNVRGGMPVDQALWNSAKPEFGILAEEVQRERRNVLAPFPQRRQVHPDHVETVEEVFPEVARLHLSFEILVRRRNQANVDP